MRDRRKGVARTCEIYTPHNSTCNHRLSQPKVGRKLVLTASIPGGDTGVRHEIAFPLPTLLLLDTFLKLVYRVLVKTQCSQCTRSQQAKVQRKDPPSHNMHMRPGALPCPSPLGGSGISAYPHIREGGEAKVYAPSRPRHTALRCMIGPVW